MPKQGNIKFEIDTRELRRFQRDLRKVNKEADNELRRKQRAAARIVRDSVRARVPGSGRLKSSITSSSTQIKVSGKGRYPRNIGSLLTSGHRTRGGGMTKRNPFIREGVSAKHRQYVDMFVKAVEKAMKFVKGKRG
ncbi:MAG: hypothetical protein F4037_13405 [Gemmatimonadales bacterium]|nr:hypothetical protein [Candidatus Palauibacter ramosifaciens]